MKMRIVERLEAVAGHAAKDATHGAMPGAASEPALEKASDSAASDQLNLL